MGYSRGQFTEKGFDEQEYRRYFNQNQAEYIRTKLRSVKLYSEGNGFKAVAKLLSIAENSVRTYKFMWRVVLRACVKR